MSSLRDPIQQQGGGITKSWKSNKMLSANDSLRLSPSQGTSHTTRGTFTRRNRGRGSFNNDSWAFGCEVAGETLSVLAGTFWIQGDNKYELAAADYALPAGPAEDDYCFPTISFLIATKVLSLKLLTAAPVMVADEVLVPLVRLKAVGTPTAVWDFDGDGFILHRGDILFATSLVFG